MQKEVLGICGQQRPRSACTSAQSGQELYCPLTESLDSTECINGEQRPEWYFAYVQDYPSLCDFHMVEDIFRLTRPKLC